MWFNTDLNTIKPGGVVTTNGIMYRIGHVGAGFDNNGDYVPDRNFWVQPIGDPDAFDMGCLRLIRTTSVITVARPSGDETSFYTDTLYWTLAKRA